MVDTCVMCGAVVPEDTWVCLSCKKETRIMKCPDCLGKLDPMHTSKALLPDGPVISTIYHCTTCHSDWEQDFMINTNKTKISRKFWG